MVLLQMILEQQQAVSLISLLLLSLAMVYWLNSAPPKVPVLPSMLRTQLILAACGLPIILVPAYAYAGLAFACIAMAAFVLKHRKMVAFQPR